MSNKSVADLVEEWQTGSFFVISSVVIGLIVAVIAASVAGTAAGFAGFIVGAIGGFFAMSYILYGR